MFILLNLIGWTIAELGLAPLVVQIVTVIDIICIQFGLYEVFDSIVGVVHNFI